MFKPYWISPFHGAPQEQRNSKRSDLDFRARSAELRSCSSCLKAPLSVGPVMEGLGEDTRLFRSDQTEFVPGTPHCTPAQIFTWEGNPESVRSRVGPGPLVAVLRFGTTGLCPTLLLLLVSMWPVLEALVNSAPQSELLLMTVGLCCPQVLQAPGCWQLPANGVSLAAAHYGLPHPQSTRRMRRSSPRTLTHRRC